MPKKSYAPMKSDVEIHDEKMMKTHMAMGKPMQQAPKAKGSQGRNSHGIGCGKAGMGGQANC